MNKTSQDKNPLVVLIEKALDSRGWNASKLAKESKVPQPVISRLLNGAKNIKVESIYKVLNTLGFLKKQETSAPIIQIQETPAFKTYHRDFSLNNYVPVRLLKDAVAAGVPAEIREWDVDGWALIYADKKWMPNKPENYTCCRVQGSSMYPILSSGDIVAIDHAERDPRRLDKKMVVFRKDGGITIKWLKVLKDGLVVGVPENKDDFDSVVSLRGDEISTGIVGKVAWWWAKR